MAKDKGQNNNPDDNQDHDNEPSFEGDLSFAADSNPGEFTPARDEPIDEGGKTWTPSPRPESHDQSVPDVESEPNIPEVEKTWVSNEMPAENVSDENKSVEAGDDQRVEDTWVPEPNASPDDTDGNQNDDPNITWVPDDTPTVTGMDQPTTEGDDPNKTWVPDDTPTVTGMDEPTAEDDDPNKTWVPDVASDDRPATPPPADADDPNKTWVPDDTPTVTGMDEPTAEDDDPNKTWVPDATTTDGPGMPPSADADDPNKTWVPSSTPTHHGHGDQAPEAEIDADKTWVPDDTPTHHDFSFDKSSDSKNDNDFDRTAVIGSDSAGYADADSDTDQTLPGVPNADADKTQIFSRTMAMRGMSAEEYEEWQAQIADRDGQETISGTPDISSSSDDGRRTQIWSKQTRNGLDSALIIRSRPVAGDDQFEGAVKGDEPDYQIVEKLAEGGMGAIYIANQTSLNRELAIKTLKPLKEHEKRTYTKQGRMSQVQKQRREMFLSEALVTANLVHPHIIPIHDLCQTNDGSPFYSMKRVNGTPWNELITAMSQEENLEVLHKVCDAVAYAHHNGVVNRDLKPENIMLGEFGEVLVLDWGLAVPATAIDNQNFSSASASFGAGTPAYMSPELWAGPAEAIGTWSDVYLMGAILYEAITGKAPHTFPEPDSKSGNSGLWKIIDQVVRKNEIRPTEVTGELMDIAMKAMHTDSEKRYASVLDFQEAIKGFQKHEESRHLAHRAAETLNSGHQSDRQTDSTDRKQEDRGTPVRQQGYQEYQTAATLYEESCNAWPENVDARSGLREARLAYAQLAHAKGDYDLGLQIAEKEDGPEFTQLTQKLTRARTVRNGLKYATLAAAGIIVIVGAISFVQAFKIARQKDQIVALYGDKEQLETDLKEGQKKVDEADAKIAAAEKKVTAANQQLTVATSKVAAAERDLADANAEVLMVKVEVKKAEADVAKAKQDAQVAESKAAIAMKEAADADAKAAVAAAAATKAQADVADAKMEIAKAEVEIAEAKVEVAKLEVAKVRAGVDLRNADIANLIRNSDYAAALREVQEMLVALRNDPELNRLPQSERDRRIQELKARQGQLVKRTRSTDSPVQTQVISPSGKTVVWGDRNGNLSAWKLTPSAGEFPEKPSATLPLRAKVTEVKISSDEGLIVAAAKNVLHLWTPDDNQHHVIEGHSTDITTVVLTENFVLAADAGGSIRSWDLQTQKERWSIRSSAGIRDLAVLPNSGMFLYAGSRGGESADVLAYQLPPESRPTERPQRLGQLRLPRNRNDPPKRIAVSPDEKLLLISNSRNGELMVLPRRSPGDFEGRDRFPFVHAADLADTASRKWIVERHQRPINDITFSADGQRIATASDDRSIGVWKLLASGELLFAERLEGHGARVNAAGFLDSSGRTVLSASADRFCRFWDVDNYRSDREAIESEFNLSSLRKNQAATAKPQSKYILARHFSDTPQAEPESPNSDYLIVNADHEMQRGAIRSVELSSDGRRIVTGAADGTAVIWDTATGMPVTGVSTRSQFQPESGSFDEGHDFNVSRLKFLPPDGDVLVTTGFDGNLCLWNADLQKAGAGTEELRVPGLGLVNAVAASVDGKLIATSAAGTDSQKSGSATLWRTENLLSDGNAVPVATFTGFHRAEVSAVAISPDSRRVATGARDGRVAIWSAETGNLIAGGRIHVKNTIVSHLEWLDNLQFLSAGFDGRLLIAEARLPPEGESTAGLNVTAKLDHDKIPIERVAFSPDRSRFITVSVRTDKATRQTDYEMELWIPTGTGPERQIKPAVVRGAKPRRIAAVNWSPDGGRVAAAVDGNLHIFDSSNWRIETVLEAPGVGVSDAVFAPRKTSDNANVIATFDGTAAHLWNLKDRSHFADFRPLFAVQATALSENTEHPLLLTGDRAIRIFQADNTSADFGQSLFKISDPHRGVITCLEFSPLSNPQTFVSAGADGSAALWMWNPKISEATLLRWLCKESVAIAATSWSPDGKQILLAFADGRVKILDAENPEQMAHSLTVNDSGEVHVSAATFSSDGRFFAVAGQIVLSGESRGWVYERTHDATPDLHCTIKGHEAGGICCCSFLPQSPYLATGGADGAGLIWNWQPERAAEGPLQAYETYQLMVDGQTIAHEAPITSLTVSSAGTIATASDDGTAIVWRNPYAR